MTGVAGRTVTVVTVVLTVVVDGFKLLRVKVVTVVTVVVGVGWVMTVVGGAVTCNGGTAPAGLWAATPEEEFEPLLSVDAAESGPSLAVGSSV